MASVAGAPPVTGASSSCRVKEITDFIACSRVAEASSSITPLEFHRQFVAASRPCVIRDGARDGKLFRETAYLNWRDDEYLLRRCGDLTVTVNYTPDGQKTRGEYYHRFLQV